MATLRRCMVHIFLHPVSVVVESRIIACDDGVIISSQFSTCRWPRADRERDRLHPVVHAGACQRCTRVIEREYAVFVSELTINCLDPVSECAACARSVVASDDDLGACRRFLSIVHAITLAHYCNTRRTV
jgi:hypothetical protein